MKTFIVILTLISTIIPSFTQVSQNDTYQFFVNLKNVSDDKLPVELITPKINSDKAVYHLPAMVPGTYSVYNYGRFIKDVKAFDSKGNELPVSKLDVNSWEISNAVSLYRVTYKAEDSFDEFADDPEPKNPVFEPAGTNFQPDTNFVFNNHTLFGYFDGYISNQYILSVTKPQNFYGATSLDAVRDNGKESFTASDYHVLVDNPIMFCVADTASFSFPEANVMIAVFSPGKGVDAKSVAENLSELLKAERDYIGGKLPTDRYTFIFYFASSRSLSGGQGALEHNRSSMYYLSDIKKEQRQMFAGQLRSTCAHEFFHTVTPLNLHAEQIGNFDFNNPQMSEHLWLYEGVTEFSAEYLQLRQGLYSLDDFLKDVNQKLSGSTRFNDTLAFTEMSKGALSIHKRQYVNVYQKGALIGLCLDILIRDESNGENGLQNCINSLLLKYGKDRSFKDEDLFNDFVELTTPKIGEFFNRYVAGYERLPYKETFDKIGLNFETIPYNQIDFGHAKIGFNMKTFRLKIEEVDSENKFVKELGVMAGDELFAVNGEQISFMNFRDIFGSTKNKIKEGDDFKLTVVRMDGDKENKVDLTAKISSVKIAYDSKVSVNKEPNERQLKIRNTWLGK